MSKLKVKLENGQSSDLPCQVKMSTFEKAK